MKIHSHALKHWLGAFLIAGAVNSNGAIVDGDIIAIDFGSLAPTGPITFNQLDAYNNSIDSGQTMDWSTLGINGGVLKNTLGADVTGVGFTVENQSGQNTSRANVTNGSTGPPPFDVSDIYQDSIISNQQAAAPLDPGGYFVFTFTGLDDSLTYDLVGGYNGANANFDSTWSFDSGSVGIPTSQNDSVAAFLSAPGASTAYQSVTGLRTDGAGNLKIQITRNTLHLNAGSLTLTALSIPTWQTDASGNWSTPANWTPFVPNAASAQAVFSDSIPLTGPLTASLDVPVTLGDLSFLSAESITVGGPSALTLNGGGAANVSASVGSHVISAAVSLEDPLDVALASGSSLDISGSLSGTTSLTNSGEGSLTLSGDLSGHTGSIISNAGTLVVSGSNASDITANGGMLEVSGTGGSDITVNAGATLSGEGSITGTLTLETGNTLSVDPTNGTSAFTTGTLSPMAPVNVDFSSNPLGLGTFTVLNYTTYAGTVATDFQSPGYRITFADTSTSITATVAAAETSNWTAAVDDAGYFYWDNGVTANWSSTDNLFYFGDAVTFTNVGVGYVDVTSVVAPASMTFTNTSGNDYIFEDVTPDEQTISAETGGITVTDDGDIALNVKITGNTSITHSGAGTLSLGGGGVDNDFVGTITVDGGGTLQNASEGPNNDLTSLGDFGNTFSFTNGSTFDVTSGTNIDRGFKGYGTASFVFGAGTTLTNSSGTTKREAFDDELDFAGDVTIGGSGRLDIDGDITVSGTNIVITAANATGTVLGASNTGKSIAEWIVNDGTLFATVDTSFGDAVVTVNQEGSITGNVGSGTDIGNGPGVAMIANAITLNGGLLKANQNNTTTNYTGTITVTAPSGIDPNNGSRTVILSGTLTESSSGIDLTVGDGTTVIASSLDATGFTGDFIKNEAGALALGNGVNLVHDLVIEDSGGNKAVQLLAGNSAEVSGSITVNDTTANDFDLNVVDAADTLTVSGVISGGGAAGVTKIGEGTAILSGTNTYTGTTTVNAGELNLNGTAIADAGSLVIAGSGTVAVTGTGDEVVDTLFVDGVQADVGTWGSGDYPGIITAGTITVLTGPPPGFAGWITGTFANGTVPGGEQGPNDDPDHDGIANLVEYAIDGQDPTVSNTTIATLVGTTLSYSKNETATGLSYAIELSTDLGDTDPWMEATGGGYVNDPSTISYTFTPGTPAKNFSRLRVIDN